MRARVTKDNSTRMIELELEGMPDLDVTESWHRYSRKIRPDKAIIHINRGETRSINIMGALIKKSGQPSANVRDDQAYMINAHRHSERLDLAPGWVQELFNQAPAGITSFSWVSPEEAQIL